MMLAPASTATDHIHRQQCLEQAARYRRLAFATGDRQAAEELLQIAAAHERNAWTVAPAA